MVTLGSKSADTVLRWFISVTRISGSLNPSCSKHDICSDDGRYPIVKHAVSFDAVSSADKLV